MHTLGQSAMACWLRTLLYYMKGNGPAVNLGKAKAEQDVEAEYKVLGESRLTAGVMTPGTATMYLLQGLLLQDQNQLANVITAYKTLQRAGALGGNQATYCRQKMQFAFAANQHVGRFADEAYLGKPDAQPLGSGERFERRRREPMQDPPEEEKKEGRGRNPRPHRGNNMKRDEKERKDKKERKRDRKYDHRYDRKKRDRKR